MTDLNKEDYVEPRCPLCSPKKKERIPLFRIIEKLDAFLGKREYLSAESLLKYWVNEATSCGDESGKLSLYNELIGLYRKTERKEDVFSICQKALDLVAMDEFNETLIRGTTFLNVATAHKAFDKSREAVEFYKKAQEIYENLLSPLDTRLCGLYNNMAVALMEVKEFNSAKFLFLKAIDILEKSGGSKTEIAITYCNLADLTEQESGTVNVDTDIRRYMEKAMQYFNCSDSLKDANYAYACEKCASAFGYYGFQEYQKELEKRARSIYDGN